MSNQNNSVTLSGVSRRDVLSAGSAGILAISINAAPMLAVANEATARSVPLQNLTARIGKVLDAIDKDRVVELALDVSDIPNPLGQEEQLARFFHARMKEAGLESRLQPFAPGRSNAIGTYRGSGGGRSLMFAGHLESGVANDRPIPKARVDADEWIRGAGIWNMKGALAAYLEAVIAVRKAGIELAGDVIIAGTAGAHDQTIVDSRIKGDGIQGYSIGTVHMLSQGLTADVGVVGEPTSFKLVRQHFGMTAVRIDISIKQPPAKWDDLTTGDWWPDMDAVAMTAEVIRAVREWAPNYRGRNKVDGVPPWVHISAIEGGGPWSPYPAMAASLFVFAGTPPGGWSETVLDEIRTVLSKLEREHESLWAEAAIYFSEPGPSVANDNPVVTGLKAAHLNVFGKPATLAVVPWHSDASPLGRCGIAAVNYGPPGEFNPTRGEGVRIQDLFDCARVYADLIVRVCGNAVR